MSIVFWNHIDRKHDKIGVERGSGVEVLLTLFLFEINMNPDGKG